jgi:hypothetical protein
VLYLDSEPTLNCRVSTCESWICANTGGLFKWTEAANQSVFSEALAESFGEKRQLSYWNRMTLAASRLFVLCTVFSFPPSSDRYILITSCVDPSGIEYLNISFGRLQLI